MPSRQAFSLFRIAIGILCLWISTPVAVSQLAASSDSSPEKNWPRPIALIEQLETLQTNPQAGRWAGEMLQLLDLLQTHSAITDANTGQVLQQIRARRRVIDTLLENVIPPQWQHTC